MAGIDVVEVAPAYDHAELTVNALIGWCSRRWPGWLRAHQKWLAQGAETASG